MSISIIIVTHNSERFIHKCLDAVYKQTLKPKCIIVVDSGSQDTKYLDRYQEDPRTTVIKEKKDIGFCVANNVGMRHIASDSEHVLFLNPDAFLNVDFLEKASKILFENPDIGCLSGELLGYDIDLDQPTGRYDSTGIFRTWYGHWFDRAQGQYITPRASLNPEYVPALCGALMYCRKEALDTVLFSEYEVWNQRFYMYKDDIDLSLRLRRAGWKLLFTPQLTAYHCRGWNSNRRCMPKKYRLLSARNEICINARDCKLGLIYSCSKYLAVKFANI